jgi:hypothetical protein
MFLAMPQPESPGEVVPPIPVEARVALTDPDTKGRRWAIIQMGDGTVSASFRIPWQLGPQFGQQLAAGLVQMAQRAASEENGGLVVPGRNAGGLFVPVPGQGAHVPRPGGGRRG